MLLSKSFIVIVAIIIGIVCAEEGPYSLGDVDRYDRGAFGRMPAEQYKSSHHSPSRLLKRTWTEEDCLSDEYFFLAPRGSHAPHTGPTITDSEGHHVWLSEGFGTAYNFQAQMYKGEQYLTWWSGNDHLEGHGEGHYFMYDKHYQLYKKISPQGGYAADLHEFKITRDNTALISIYDRIPWDLTELGATNNNSYLWDNLFQEVDIETNELLFEWRASDHFDFADCYNPRKDLKIKGKEGWDWFHLNSVDKDDKGNYLISSRYSHSLAYIDHKTGQVLWQLGGRNNSFTNLSGGIATGVSWQHHATWQDDYTAVTVYDNNAVNWNRTEESRALKIRLDQNAMTAEVVAMALHPQHYIVHSQGSVSQLSNGNLFVGYGFAAAMTEYSPDGKQVLCDWQYASLHFLTRGTYSPGLIQSYRTYKLPWKGYPLEPPAVAFESGMFYVSWNGATEHREWVLQGSNDEDQRDLKPVGETTRGGFESEIPLDEQSYETYMLTALDASEDVLGTWKVTINGTVIVATSPSVASTSHVSAIFSLSFLAAVLLAVYRLVRRNVSILSRIYPYQRLSCKDPSF